MFWAITETAKPIPAKPARTTEPADLIDAEAQVDVLAARIPTAAAEPGLDAVRAEGQRRHREGIRILCGRLGDLGVLRNGADFEETVAVVATMTNLPFARALVLQHGWTWDRWQAWTIDALTRLVLGDHP